MTNEAKPGAILKAFRLKKGWTLSEVSDRTGFPVSTLSKIENDKVSLSYDKLAKISTGLDVDIGMFFAGMDAKHGPAVSGASGRRSIIRKGDGQTIETGSYFNRYLATDLLNKRFVPMIGEGLATSIEEFGEMIRHEGEEFCYVLEGCLELHTELYAPVRLEPGDAIYFDSGIGHAYISVGDTPCRALCICSGEESKLHMPSGASSSLPARSRPKEVQVPPSNKSAALTGKMPKISRGSGKRRKSLA